MIKLFRNVRQKLIAEGSIGNYAKYAIGEIFLVVIGILIALSINNWNEERKQSKRSVEYHQRLHEDLDRLIEQNEDITSIADRTLRSIGATVNCLEKGRIESSADSNAVDFAMIWFSRTNYQMPELPTYEEMKSNGDLNLIYDVEFRNKLANFNNFLEQVESVVFKLSSAIESDFQIFNRYLRSYVDPDSLEVTYSYDFDRMAADEEFINTFSRLSYHWRGYVYFMIRMKRDAEKLSSELDTYLEEVEKGR